MAGLARPGGFVAECPDPGALARFYSDLTGWPVLRDEGDWATVANEDGKVMRLSFQQAPGYQPPTWPDRASSMQYHIDFDVDDLDEAERHAIEVGARKAEHQPDPDNFRVFFDPVGHVFCLCID